MTSLLGRDVSWQHFKVRYRGGVYPKNKKAEGGGRVAKKKGKVCVCGRVHVTEKKVTLLLLLLHKHVDRSKKRRDWTRLRVI